MKGLVISSGSILDYSFIAKEIEDRDIIVCADGGIRHLIKLEVKADRVIGDLDSVDQASMNYIKEKKIRLEKYPVEKNETDTELAINYLLKKGCKDIILIGVTGSRLDHTLANIFILKKLKNKNIKSKIIDCNNTIYFEDAYLRLKRKDKVNVSVIPLREEGAVVTLKGFYYPLIDEEIDFASTLGISNKIIEDYGEIFVTKGEILIFESKD